jgi:hypothetical protein
MVATIYHFLQSQEKYHFWSQMVFPLDFKANAPSGHQASFCLM